MTEKFPILLCDLYAFMVGIESAVPFLFTVLLTICHMYFVDLCERKYDRII